MFLAPIVWVILDKAILVYCDSVSFHKPLNSRLSIYNVVISSASDCIALGNEVSDYKAASSIGIEAYNCMWGAKDEDRDIMYKEMRDVTLKRPKEIIEVLKRSQVK